MGGKRIIDDSDNKTNTQKQRQQKKHTEEKGDRSIHTAQRHRKRL